MTRVGEMTIVGETETETAEKGTTEIGTGTEEGTEGKSRNLKSKHFLTPTLTAGLRKKY